MPRHIDLMTFREERIGELIEAVGLKCRNFTDPPLIVIGGYALRGHVPFSRYSRDCDFATPKGARWTVDRVEGWLSMQTEAKEKKENHGYLRLIELASVGRHRIKISLDFMEGEIRGRGGESFTIDDQFLADAISLEIPVGSRSVGIRVPSYPDYYVLKLLSGRPGDIRDLAALTWKNGVPGHRSMIKRIKAAVNTPHRMIENLEVALADIADPSFLDSWRGTFINQNLTDSDRKKIIRGLQGLKESMQEAF